MPFGIAGSDYFLEQNMYKNVLAENETNLWFFYLSNTLKKPFTRVALWTFAINER